MTFDVPDPTPPFHDPASLEVSASHAASSSDSAQTSDPEAPNPAPQIVLPAIPDGPRPLIAFLAYLGMALLATWPLATVATTHCWGARYDLWGNLWLIWYFHQAMEQGSMSFSTPLLFYPEGFSLWAYGHVILQIMVAPLMFLTTAPMAYAVMVWGALSASAFAIYLLAADLTRSRWAGFLGGALYAFHSLKYAELAVGSVEQAATLGLPLFTLSLLRWREHGGWKWGAATYAAIMLTALGNWFFGIALALFTVLFVAFHLVCRRNGALYWDWPLLGRACLLGLLCLISVAPFLGAIRPQILSRPPLNQDVVKTWPRGQAATSRPLAPALAETDEAPADVTPFLSEVSLDYIATAANRQTVSDSLPLDRVLGEELLTLPRSAGPGFQIVLLGLLGLLLGGPRARFWAFGFVVLTVISMGPFLRISEVGPPTEIELPYYHLYNLVDIFRVGYRPYRFQSAALMCGVVLAAYGVAAVLRRLPNGRLRALMGLSLLVVSMFVRWVLCSPNRAVMLADARIPSFYSKIDGPAVEIPYHHWAFGNSNSRFQYYQSAHGQPILNNQTFINMQQLLRLRRLVTAHPLVLTLSEGQYGKTVEAPATLKADVAWMREAGFRWIIVHTSFPRDAFHLTGWQENKEMIREPFVAFLEQEFGPPEVVDGALLFAVDGSPRPAARTKMPDSAALEFSGDYERTQVPLRFGRNDLYWYVGGQRPRRIAFWALAEPGTEQVQVRITALLPAGPVTRTRIVPLSQDHWQRVALNAHDFRLPTLRGLQTLAIEPVRGDTAHAAISHLQLLR